MNEFARLKSALRKAARFAATAAFVAANETRRPTLLNGIGKLCHEKLKMSDVHRIQKVGCAGLEDICLVLQTRLRNAFAKNVFSQSFG